MDTRVAHMSWSELETAAAYKTNRGTTGNDAARVKLAEEARAELEARRDVDKKPYGNPPSSHWLWKK